MKKSSLENDGHMEDKHRSVAIEDVGEFELELVGMTFWNEGGFIQGS